MTESDSSGSGGHPVGEPQFYNSSGSGGVSCPCVCVLRIVRVNLVKFLKRSSNILLQLLHLALTLSKSSKTLKMASKYPQIL